MRLRDRQLTPREMTVLSVVLLLIGGLSLRVIGQSACDGWMNTAKVCVPAATLEADYKAFKEGNPPISESADSRLRQVGFTLDAMSTNWHTCEAQLAQATAGDKQKAIASADEAMFKRLNDEAPVGKTGQKQVWSKDLGRYVDAPPATAGGRGQQAP